MRKILIFLISVIMISNILSIFSVSAASTTYKIADLKGKYKTQGRTVLQNGTLFMEWSASGIEFNAKCSGSVIVEMETLRTWTGDTNGAYFTVIVDGAVQSENKRIPTENHHDSWKNNSTNYPFHITNKGKASFVIAKDLKDGVHNFKIFNQSEAVNASYGIHSITLNGEFVDPPQESNLFIEFIGDSITAGYGNIAHGGGGEVALYKDATRGWPYLTANKLGADWSVVATSGIAAGNGYGWSDEKSVSMQTVYPKLRYYSDKQTDYNFERQPDVVVLGLGTNDMWTYKNAGKTENDVKNEFKAMLNLVMEKNPNSKIIWIYGMMLNSADSLIKNTVEELGGIGKGLYTLQLPLCSTGHPGEEFQPDYAAKLSLFISKIVDVSVQKPTSAPSNDKELSSSVVSDRFNRTSSKKSSEPKDNSSEVSSNKTVSESVSSKIEKTSSKAINNSSVDTSTSSENADVSSENEKTEPQNKPPYLLVGIVAAAMVVVAAIISVLIKIKK